MKQKTHSLLLHSLWSSLLAALIFSGCGGGSSNNSEPDNEAPEIITMTANKTTVDPGGTVTFQGFANDADGDSLSYIWSSTEGTLATSNPKNPVLTVPQSSCDSIQVTLTVTDGKASDSESILLSVSGGSDCGDVTTSSNSSYSNSYSSSSTSSNSNSSTSGSSTSDSSNSNSSTSGSSTSDSSNSNSSTSGSSTSDSSNSNSSTSDSSSSDAPVDNNPYMNPGYFTPSSDAEINVKKISNINTIQGGLENEPVIANGGEIIKNGENVGTSTVVTDGDLIQLALTTGEDYLTTYNATLRIAEYVSEFSVETIFARDTEPKDFDLGGPVEDADRDTVYSSNEVTIEGITVTTPASISGGDVYVNGQKQSGEYFNVENKDVIKVDVTSSSNFEETTEATLTVGTLSKTFIVTTAASEVQIWIEDQRLKKNEEINIDVSHYLISFFPDDRLSCSFSGQMPTGLSYDEVACTISGTTSDLKETRSVTIGSTSQYGMTVEKEISITVDDWTSKVQKTGQTDSFTTGDDGYYADILGVPLEFETAFGFVIDDNKKLYWQDNETSKKSIQDAQNYCAEFSLNGMKGWRLPSIAELESINNDAINFSYLAQGNYWSNTPFVDDTSKYWYIDTSDDGKSYYDDQTVRNYVRCVRSSN